MANIVIVTNVPVGLTIDQASLNTVLENLIETVHDNTQHVGFKQLHTGRAGVVDIDICAPLNNETAEHIEEILKKIFRMSFKITYKGGALTLNRSKELDEAAKQLYLRFQVQAT